MKYPTSVTVYSVLPLGHTDAEEILTYTVSLLATEWVRNEEDLGLILPG